MYAVQSARKQPHNRTAVLYHVLFTLDQFIIKACAACEVLDEVSPSIECVRVKVLNFHLGVVECAKVRVRCSECVHEIVDAGPLFYYDSR